MVLIPHIIIASLSLLLGADLLLRPTSRKIQTQIALIILTLFSGTLLVISQHGAHLLSVCMSGLAFLAFTSFSVALAHYRLAKEKN